MTKPRVRDYQQKKRKDTPDTVGILLTCLEEGMTRRGACAIAGINQDTFYTWLKENPEFADAVVSAESRFEQEMVLGIKREPKGKMWLLERRLRSDWSPPKLEIDASQKVEHVLVFEAVEQKGDGANKDD